MLALAPRLRHSKNASCSELMGLLEMINFSLHDFTFAFRLIVEARDYLNHEQQDQPIQHHVDLVRNIKWASIQIASFKSQELANRLKAVVDHLSEGSDLAKVTNAVVVYELNSIIRLIEDQIKIQGFFHYQPDDADKLKSINRQWSQTLDSFMEDDLKQEITAGIDCYALGHYTACVFHMMRIAEVGLRHLARERQITLPRNTPIEYANWQQILDAINARIKEIGQTVGSGGKKDLMLKFYQTALIELNALKDIFRNQVMHVRHPFTRYEAEQAIEKTCRLMHGLGLYIFSDAHGPIDWDDEWDQELRYRAQHLT